MNLALCGQMRAVDNEAIHEFNIPGIVLMENAALSVFEICARLAAYSAKRAAIFCGVGNNGGDGFAVARHMYNDKAKVVIVLVGDPEKIKGDAGINYEICKRMGIDILVWNTHNLCEIEKVVASCPLIIDAVLGTGSSGELRGAVKEAVSLINSAGFVVAVDCPTGGNADNGQVTGACVKADLTISLALLKPGLLLYPLTEYAGKIEIGSIGAPTALLERPTGLYAIDEAAAAKLLPKRYERSHKGTYGKAVMVAGSANMTGAAAFCANAAYRVGCGYVKLCAPAAALSNIQRLAPQAVTAELPEGNGAVHKALDEINGATVCLIGPGLGISDRAVELVKHIVQEAKTQLVLDADALNAISDEPEILKSAAFPPVITPHPLEMSRLSGLAVRHILDNMLGTAADFSSRYNAVTVLKDATTIIAGKDRVYINKAACSAMAKAGSGDILAGIITGLLAQKMDAVDAAALGAFIHSRSGVAAALRYGDYSVSSEDIIKHIHQGMDFQNNA